MVSLAVGRVAMADAYSSSGFCAKEGAVEEAQAEMAL